jgi:peptidoglycan/LPS O-acetylase OafA/YrhL
LAFYRRRMRRIFPALIVVLLTCYVFGWFALLPREFEQLGKHIASSSAFFINFVLWKEAGYFDTASEIKPLLHLWSLSVEEQFYLFFPLALMLAWKLRRNAFTLIIFLTMSSFAFNVILIDKNPVMTFFLPHTRLWEILLGGAIACVASSDWAPSGRAHRCASLGVVPSRPTGPLACAKVVAAVAGLCLVVIPALLLHRTQPFPGWRALFPAFGAALLIVAGKDTWLNRRILSCRPIVLLGLISYPLYLWHWPLLSFARLMQSTEPPVEVRVGAVAASCGLAYFSYRLIEKPIRAKSATPQLAGTLCLLLFASAVLGSYSFNKNGLAFRLEEHLAQARQFKVSASEGKIVNDLLLNECFFLPRVYLISKNSPVFWRCQRDKREDGNFILLGDSHANSFFHGLVAASTSGRRWQLFTIAGCSFLSGGIGKVGEDYCNDVSPKAIDLIARNTSIREVLFVFANRELNDTYFSNDPNDRSMPAKQLYLAGLSRSFATIEKAGKRVLLLVDNPFVVWDPSTCGVERPLTPFWIKERCSIPRVQHEQSLEGFRKLVRELQAKHPRLVVFDPTNLYCDALQCRVAHNGRSLYSYTDHLSDYASEIVARELLKFLSTVDPAL